MTDLLRAAGVDLVDVGHVVHGTTLVTNAIIERSGARLGLLTTRGFRDNLKMGTEQRYDIHDLFLAFPAPLAVRERRREFAERVSRDGAVLEAIDLDAVRREVRELVDDGVEALAVCFLHAYRNPVHEREVRELVRTEFPDLTVSISSDAHPQINEYERSSTTAANAYVQPLMSAYVRRLDRVLRERGFRGAFTSSSLPGGSPPRGPPSGCQSGSSSRGRRAGRRRAPSSGGRLATPTSSPSTWGARRPRRPSSRTASRTSRRCWRRRGCAGSRREAAFRYTPRSST